MAIGKPPLIVPTCAACGRLENDHDVRHLFVRQEVEEPKPPPPSPEESEKSVDANPQGEEGPEGEDDGRPSTAESRGEMIRRYQEQHLCIGCNHVEVCEMGRHTAEMFREGWFVVLRDCNFHESAD